MQTRLKKFSISIITMFLAVQSAGLAQAQADVDCRGECISYFPGNNCPSGMHWDFSLRCPTSDSDLRCCSGEPMEEPVEEEDFADPAIIDNEDEMAGTFDDSFEEIGGPLVSGAWDEGITTAGEESGLPDTDYNTLLTTVLQWLLTVFVFLAIIAFVVSGVMFLLSGADKNMAEKAKSAVGYSILGIAAAFSGLIIINIVLKLLNGGEAM